MVLLQGPRGGRFLMSEVPLYMYIHNTHRRYTQPSVRASLVPASATSDPPHLASPNLSPSVHPPTLRMTSLLQGLRIGVWGLVFPDCGLGLRVEDARFRKQVGTWLRRSML